MILQLPPKDEEEPLIPDKEMEGFSGPGGEPETAEKSEFNDAVTRYRRSQPVYTQPDGSDSAKDGSSELDLQTLGALPIDLNPYHIGSLDVQGIEKWKQEYPEEVEDYVDKAVDYYAKILWPEGQQGAGGISKNSPLLQSVPVSLPGGGGE